ncbi:RNA polymerase sigma-70 factor (ECF subfamily) [Haloferula luteola]|uniref:RNA polymerase sigma-70 factor (ECF subfamily) n=1 Tax=Haloferula luteola TaxID=595692 RepID=A0A840V3D3_9BACT|nr:sigma-70 family RNA polymerase sigma factor [Haloferula luteola]MBB5352505.1 RNA polymerase sigma-70 factor (ECF subfamily) [Haloferula luteola]
MKSLSPPLPPSGADELVPFPTVKGIKPSLREVFEAEEGPLLRFAWGMLGRREIAEDLVQEAFLRLHAHWDEVTHPRAWLFRSVRNLALNHLRHHRRESVTDVIPDEDATGDPKEQLSRLEAAGAIRLLLAELGEDDRALLTLKYDEDLKYAQISERTGLSVGNVGYKLHHLLKGLAERLRRMGIESSDG